jgi:hypothetical protein
MAFTATVTPFQLTPTETWTTAKFNQGFNPTIAVTGNLSAVSDWNLVSAETDTFTVYSLDDDILTATAHGRSTGDRVTVSSSTTLPSGLVAGTQYFLRVHSGAPLDRFTLHYTADGAANNTDRVPIASAGTGTHTLSHTPYSSGITLIFNSSTSKWEYGIVSPNALPEFVGASTTVPGTRGAVPQPAPGPEDDYLARDGTWKALPEMPSSAGATLFSYHNLR